jgi:hypothetical protein
VSSWGVAVVSWGAGQLWWSSSHYRWASEQCVVRPLWSGGHGVALTSQHSYDPGRAPCPLAGRSSPDNAGRNTTSRPLPVSFSAPALSLVMVAGPSRAGLVRRWRRAFARFARFGAGGENGVTIAPLQSCRRPVATRPVVCRMGVSETGEIMAQGLIISPVSGSIISTVF